MFYFFHILGKLIPTDDWRPHIFQRGRSTTNHNNPYRSHVRSSNFEGSRQNPGGMRSQPREYQYPIPHHSKEWWKFHWVYIFRRLCQSINPCSFFVKSHDSYRFIVFGGCYERWNDHVGCKTTTFGLSPTQLLPFEAKLLALSHWPALRADMIRFNMINRKHMYLKHDHSMVRVNQQWAFIWSGDS